VISLSWTLSDVKYNMNTAGILLTGAEKNRSILNDRLRAQTDKRNTDDRHDNKPEDKYG
jgi:hypothetical protein